MMSMFGFYFVTGLLREAGWPREQRFWFFKKQVVATLILDDAVDQMVDWAAALGSERPTLALRAIAEIFREKDWSSESAPNIRTFIERAREVDDKWRGTELIAPHEVVQPTRFAGAGADSRAAEGIMKKGARWNWPVMDMNSLKELRQPLEHWFLRGALWGLGNPDAFEKWYAAQAQHQAENLSLYRQHGLAVDAPADLSSMVADSEQILRNYERDISPLPAIPDRLLSDARALGRQV